MRDALIPGDDSAEFAGCAATQFHGGLDADTRKIHGIVTGGIQKSEEAEGLFHQHGGLCMSPAVSRRKQESYENEFDCEPGAPKMHAFL
jgi:hypothetical protein